MRSEGGFGVDLARVRWVCRAWQYRYERAVLLLECRRCLGSGEVAG